MAQESVNDFYRFGILMVEDSKLLYENNRLHNSVYFAVFALEAYLKMKLRMNNARYKGHISDQHFIDRVLLIDSDLIDSGQFFNMINNYDINDRYMIDEWTNASICNKIQDELIKVNNLLIGLNRGIDL